LPYRAVPALHHTLRGWGIGPCEDYGLPDSTCPDFGKHGSG
jgi:hypothetical protein